jgi:signal transduction histidine kinase
MATDYRPAEDLNFDESVYRQRNTRFLADWHSMCNNSRGNGVGLPRPHMPGISHRTFQSTIRGPSAQALESLAPHAKSILARWNREVRALGIEDLLEQFSLDFEHLAKSLCKSSYASFRQNVQEFGRALAQRGVPLDHSTTAINQLFEICVRYLSKSEPARSTPVVALSRLHALVVLLIVAGYADQKSLETDSLPHTPIVPIAERRHDASVYVTKVYEEERKRLSRDLHDEVGHDLVLIKLYLEMIALDTNKDSNRKEFQGIRPRLSEAIAIVSHAIDSVRRLVLDLGPAVFDDLGFLPAVRTYTGQFSSRTKIAVTLREGYLPENIPMSHQIALYRLLQGALSNVLKHARAKTVKVSLGCMNDSVLILVIQDDGVGFNTSVKPASHSFGLTAMRERVEVLGGRIHIQSVPAGSQSKLRGTRIEVDLPLPGGAQ